MKVWETFENHPIYFHGHNRLIWGEKLENALPVTADLWKFCIIWTPDSEVNRSSGTEGDAAPYQLSWRQKSIFKGQMEGLAVHYFVCAVHWRINVLQKARKWFVAVTEEDRWTKERKGEVLCTGAETLTDQNNLHHISLASFPWCGRRAQYFHCFLAASDLEFWKVGKWQRNAKERLDFFFFF